MMADKLKTSLNLDAELMQKLKMIATVNNKSVTEELENAIRKYVDSNIKKVRELVRE